MIATNTTAKFTKLVVALQSSGTFGVTAYNDQDVVIAHVAGVEHADPMLAWTAVAADVIEELTGDRPDEDDLFFRFTSDTVALFRI